MGMAASQGRLLSLTARMSDLELQAQVISNSKIRLSQESQQASRKYSEALDKEMLRVNSGELINGSMNYIEATAANLTTFEGVSSTDHQQRFIKDSAGRLIVSQTIATAYTRSNGDLETFLNNVGGTSGTNYTTYANPAARTSAINTSLMASYNTAVNQVLSLIKVNGQTPTQNTQYDSNATLQLAATTGGFVTTAQGNAFKAAIDKVVNVLNQINSTFSLNPPVDTSTLEACATSIGAFPGTATGYVDDVASCLLQNTTTLAQNYINPTTMSANNLSAGLNTANTGAVQYGNSAAVTYYTNLFNEIQESGGVNVQPAANMNSSEWLTGQINAGNLFLYVYNEEGGPDQTGDFENVSWQTGDNSLRMYSDDRDLARAEAEYERTMADIQAKDKRFDLELKDIDTEHTAIQTEIDSVKKVINKNIERSFKIFDA